MHKVNMKQWYLCEGQHVKVCHMVLIGMSNSLLALLRVNQFPNVLHDKITLNVTKQCPKDQWKETSVTHNKVQTDQVENIQIFSHEYSPLFTFQKKKVRIPEWILHTIKLINRSTHKIIIYNNNNNKIWHLRCWLCKGAINKI